MRPVTACVSCRIRRRKCIVSRQGSACTNCEKSQLKCSFIAGVDHNVVSPRSDGTSPIALQSSIPSDFECHSPADTDRVPMPSLALCEELVDLYFRYIHDTFHSLFHRPSLLEDVRLGTIPRVILLSIVSLSCRFSQDDFFNGMDPRVRGRPYAKEAGRLLDLQEVSVQTIQASVLLGACAITEGEAMLESVYYSVACRIALLLDLPNLRTSTRIEQETNVRIWWTLTMIDVWSSNGVCLPRCIQPRDDIPHPMEELVFLRMRREDLDHPSPMAMQESEGSLLTQMVKLNVILYEISQLNRGATNDLLQLHLASSEFGASVDNLGRKLDNWYMGIPLQLKDTLQNLERHASLGLGHFFVAVYLGYHHYGQLLYYHYLHQNVIPDENTLNGPPTTHATYYADRCQYHSTALCEMLYRAYEIPGCEVYYTMVGHVLVVASTVQLFILLFSPVASETAAARERLEKNFEILTTLQRYWPTLDVCFTRFREFHKACLDEKKSEKNFRMDRWMHQFLFEFAKPVTTREAGVS